MRIVQRGDGVSRSWQAHGGVAPITAIVDLKPRLDFSLQVIVDRGRVNVRVRGEIDIATAGFLERAVLALLLRGCARVVVDLRAVTFLDCSGIRALLAVDRRGAELGAVVSLIVGDGQPRRVLELTGAVDHFNVKAAVDDVDRTGRESPRAAASSTS